MKLRELWRLSSTVYKEVSFQSVFSLRSGGLLPKREQTIKQLVNNAQVNTLISKIITSVFIGAFAVVVFLQPNLAGRQMTGSAVELGGLSIIGAVTAFLVSVLFLIVFMGLQVSTSFISSRIVEIMSPLPLSRRDISNVVFVCFLRIFDLPLITALVAFVFSFMLFIGSPIGGFIALVAVLVTESFAVTGSIALSRFFYSRVSGAGGRSKWKSLTRVVFMIVWILPTIGIYLVLNFALQIVESFGALMQTLSSFASVLALVYPFSFGFLISYATSTGSLSLVTVSLSIVAVFMYVFAAYYSVKWVTKTVRNLGAGIVVSAVRELVKDTLIKTTRPWLGIIRKDLRVASRAPSFASLFFLPVAQTLVLALSFAYENVDFASALGILIGMSMLTLIVAPILFSIEGLSSSYSRTLPLRRRTLIGSKTVLSTLTYVISLLVLFAVSLSLSRDFSVLLTLGSVYALSIAAGNMLELSIMANKFWKEGFAIGNIYSRLSTYILVILPGVIVVAIPIVTAVVAYLYAEQLLLAILAASCALEFAAMSSFVALRER